MKRGGVKDSISLVESRTLLKYGSVKDSIDEFNLVESRTLDENNTEPKLKRIFIW